MAVQWLDTLVDRLKVNRRDVTAFLLSLLLAFGIWMLYNMNQSYSATLQARVYLKSNLPGYFPQTSEPVTVEARCRATGYDMLRSRRRMRGRPVTIAVDPELLTQDGDGQFLLSSNTLGAHIGELFGSEVRLESFISPSYAFRFPQENHKRVPVLPVCYLSFRPQYMQKAPLSLQPDSVIVYGDSAHLENIERINTRRISLSGISSTRTGRIGLECPRGVRLSDAEVGYTVEVTRYVEIRRSVPVSVRNVPRGKDLSVYPSMADVYFRCAFPLSADRTSEVQFYIDYGDFTHSVSGKCVARTDALPQGIISWSMQPEVFDCVEEIR